LNAVSPRPIANRASLCLYLTQKDASPAKNVEASSAAAPDEKAEPKKIKPHKRKAIVRRRNNYEPGFGMGYAQYPQRPFSNW
jgi:hypothetical protein